MNSPGQNTGVGSLSLLHRIFPTQGLNPGIPHSRWILYQLNHQGSPNDSSVKNLPPVQETQGIHVGFLGQEDPLKEEMKPAPVFFPGKSHGHKSLEGYSPWGGRELDTTGYTHAC